MSKFSARPQTLGYLHQVRYALVVLLGREEAELHLEHLDDIDLAEPGSPHELLQLKHRASAEKLTDASSDLWKTIRVWSAGVRDRSFALEKTIFSLVTTAQAPNGSAASLLSASAARNPEAAGEILIRVAQESANVALAPAFAAFRSLDAQSRDQLLQHTYVLDGSPDITNARAQLEERLAVSVQREHRVALADRVEGWWFGRCVDHLRGQIPSLSGYEVFDKVVDLAQQFQRDALPIDFLGEEPSSAEKRSLARRVFVNQLEATGVGVGRVTNAIVDYYRAFAQRSRWARDDLLVGGEVEVYEERLRDEWDRMRLALFDELEQPAAEEVLKKLGRDLLTWMELRADIKIRPRVLEPYVMRGSYHMLADEDPPRVWWHPEFVARIANVLGHSNQ